MFKRLLVSLLAFMLISYSARAQVRESFSTFVLNLPLATSPLSNTDRVAVVQGGISTAAFSSSFMPPGSFIANNPSYGSCVWDLQHDVGSCINAALTASSILGGGIVYIPQGAYGLSTKILLNNPFVKLKSLVGSGDHHDVGTSPVIGTQLYWIGAAGGTMMRVAPTSGATAQHLSNVGVEGIMFRCDGSPNTAGIGLQVANVQRSEFKDIAAWECSTAGIDSSPSATLGEIEGNGTTLFSNILTQNIAAGDGAPGIQMNGDTTGNTNFTKWEQVNSFYHNGPGIRVIEGDNNYLLNIKSYRTAGGKGQPIDFNQSYTLGLGSNSNFVWGVGFSSADGTAAITSVGTGGTDAVSNGTTTYTSAMGDFSQADVGKGITGGDIAGGTTISAVVSPTQITLSQAATGTHTGLSYTVTGRSAALRNSVFGMDTSNGEGYPVIGTNSTLTWSSDQGYQFGTALINSVAGENPSDAGLALSRKVSSESLHLYNLSGDAMRVDNGTTMWGIDQTGNDLQIVIPGTGPAITFKASNLATAIAGDLIPASTTVAGLPTCVAGLAGSIRYVTDQNTAVSYLGAVTGGGTSKQRVLCNGSAWVQD